MSDSEERSFNWKKIYLSVVLFLIGYILVFYWFSETFNLSR